MHQPSPAARPATAAAAGGGGLYLEAYEVSFPLEESVERPAAYHMSHGPQMMEGTSRLLHFMRICCFSCVIRSLGHVAHSFFLKAAITNILHILSLSSYVFGSHTSLLARGLQSVFLTFN